MLEQEIQAAIQKNLPAQVAGELKEYIEKAEKAFEENKTWADRYNKLEGGYKERQVRIIGTESSLKKVCTELDAYKAREALIKDAEHKLEIAELKINHANDKALAITNIVNSVFSNRNFRYTEMVQESKSGQAPYQHGSTFVSETSSKTKTIEGQD